LDPAGDQWSGGRDYDLQEEAGPAQTERVPSVDEEVVDLADSIAGVDEDRPERCERHEACGHCQPQSGQQNGDRDQRQRREWAHHPHQHLGYRLGDS
jgi:hypothetical protein